MQTNWHALEPSTTLKYHDRSRSVTAILPRIGRLADPWTADIMVLNPHPSVFKDGELSPLPCAEFASQYGSNVCQCAGELVSRFNVGAMFSKLCPWLQNCSFHLPFFGNCEEFVEKALLATSIGAAVAWLIVPEDWWDEWLCGYAMLALAIIAVSLWNAQRQYAPHASFYSSFYFSRIHSHALTGCACGTPSRTRPRRWSRRTPH